MTAKTVQAPASLYLPAGQDSAPGMWSWVNTHTQAGDKVIWPTGTAELRSILYNLGRAYWSANPLDPAASPLWHRPNSINDQVVELRAAPETVDPTKIHGGTLAGIKLVGSNGGWQQFSSSTYGEMGVYVDPARANHHLCGATLCDIGYVWGDPYYGGGEASASVLHHAGRHGRTMNASGAKLTNSIVHHIRQRVVALETGHTIHGLEVSGTTFSYGGAAYMAGAVSPGTTDGVVYPHGLDWLGNHSTLADTDAAGLLEMAWGGQWVFAFDGTKVSSEVYIEDNKFVEVALDGNRAVLDRLFPHYDETLINVPALTVNNVNGLHVLRNEHLCRGAWLATNNCTNVDSESNVGGPEMTRQV